MHCKGSKDYFCITQDLIYRVASWQQQPFVEEFNFYCYVYDVLKVPLAKAVKDFFSAASQTRTINKEKELAVYADNSFFLRKRGR